MKLMVFNTQHCLNYVTREIDFPLMAQTIKQFSPDVVGLTEMRDESADPEYGAQVPILAKLTGLEHHCFAEAIRFGGVNPYGNGLLSRLPIVRVERLPIPDPTPRAYDGYYETRCVLKARLKGGITVLVAHFGLNPDEQENAVRTVLPHITDEKCVLMGDFNVTPDNPVLDPIRVRMTDTADVFTKPLLSFPSDEPRVKIDYIFVSRDIQVLAADIPALVASDHRPHLATVTLPE